MADRRRKKNQRFLKETSDRSGFDNWSYDGKSFQKKWTATKQKGLTIEPEEFDSPPPSNRPLGGSDISGTPRANPESISPLSSSLPSVQYLSASSTITYRDYPYTAICGSNQAVTLTSDPKIAAGGSNQVLTLMGVGSSVTLTTGNGIVLNGNKSFTMDSGALMVLVYQNTAWYEKSRSHMYASLGEL